MFNYILKRILQGIPVIFGVITISFVLMYVAPGDPVLAMVGDYYDEDTLVELRNSWAQVDHHDHVHEFIDMHHIGDMLLASQFSDPVVDMEVINFQYQSLQQLLRDLKDTGSRGKFNTTNSKYSLGLMGKEKYQRLVVVEIFILKFPNYIIQTFENKYFHHLFFLTFFGGE